MDMTLLDSATNSSSCSCIEGWTYATKRAVRFSLRIKKKPRTSRCKEEEMAGRGKPTAYQGGGRAMGWRVKLGLTGG
jgi:hypothetical protein